MGTTGPISIVDLTDPDDKSACARSILERLPDWFGIPQAREEYIERVRSLPFYAAVNPNEAYRQTSQFYRSESCPCLIMLKAL